VTPLLAQRLRTDRSFERLYRRYAEDVYRYALGVSRNAADAEDVTQTTFLNAYRAVQRGEDPRSPKNWLIAIAHNVLRQRFRQQARRPEQVELDDAAGATVPDGDAYNAADIRRALGELAFNQRAALVMRELEGRSYAEIAEILGISVSAVETLIFRARRALREQLESSLTCDEAERAISLQLDGRLPRGQKGALRAHLRTCKECATLARRHRAQRSALKGLGAIQLPSSLASLFGGGAGTGGAVAAKLAAAGAAGLLVAGGSLEAAQELRANPAPRAAEASRPDASQQVTARAVPTYASVPAVVRRPALPREHLSALPAVSRRTQKKPKIAKAKASAPVQLGATNRARPLPPVRAHGPSGAPGQLKPDPVAGGTQGRAAARPARARAPRAAVAPTRSNARPHAAAPPGAAPRRAAPRQAAREKVPPAVPPPAKERAATPPPKGENVAPAPPANPPQPAATQPDPAAAGGPPPSRGRP
jgi:RNA polymerase sigma-70 factor (ECF subfamily)